MPAEIAKGTVKVTYDAAQAEKSARDAILPGITRIAGDMAGVFAGKKIFDFAKQGFEELGAAQKVTAQTTVILKNLGAQAGVTQADVDDLATAQLRLSGVDDEVAKAAENTLLRLGETGDGFKRATADSNDLAVAMGTDMASAAETLGKALADPEKAARLLKPAIGALTAEQQASIKTFQDEGDIAGAQGVIFDALEAKVSGSAKAYGETLPGQVAIAKESLTNMKAELVAGTAPALEIAAKGATFLTEEFDKLPASAQAVVGGVGLGVAAVTSLARPVGDVVRLYQTWRERSQEVATAQQALAAAEAQEATASAAGAASTATATGVTIASTTASNEQAAAALRRVVSNDQIVFSDEELVAAELAARDAEMLRLISNDALIAADEERIAADAALKASEAEMGIGLGTVAVAAVALGAAFLYTATQASHEAQVNDRLSKSFANLSPELDKVATGEETATKVLTNFIDGMIKADQVVHTVMLGPLGNKDLTITKALNDAGVSAEQFSKVVEEGGPKLSSFLGSIKDPETQQGLVAIASGMEQSAKKSLDAGVALGDYSAKQRDAAIAANTSADGSVNYVKALEEARTATTSYTGKAQEQTRSVEELRNATDDLTDAEKAELKAADAALKAHQDFPAFINDLADAMDRSYQSTFAVTNLNLDYAQSLNGLEDALKKNGLELDISTDKTGRYNEKAIANQQALEQTGGAIAKLIENRFKETHSVEAAVEAGDLYVANLESQLKAAGYNEDQIAQMIDTMNLTPDDIRTEFSNNAVEQQIVVAKYEQELDDLKNRPAIKTDIEALINQGKYDEANAALNELAQGKTVDFTVNVHGGGQIYLTDSATGATTSEVDISARNVPFKAAGGPIGPNAPFIGAEDGFEILWKKGMYQAPPQGGFVTPHAQSAAILAAMGGSSKPAGPQFVYNGPVTFGNDRDTVERDQRWLMLTTQGI